jgi:glycosyltransferase involved in cell wall biosynthesis
VNSIVVLLATYNGEEYLEQQLQTLFAQTHSVDIIIRDDGSTDATKQILQSYKERDSVTIIEDDEQNLGARGNFNKLLEYVLAIPHYDYVMFSDQDDLWEANKVELTLKKMRELEERHGESLPLLIHSDLIVANKSGDTIADSYWDYQHLDPTRVALNQLLVQNVMTGCTIMINRSLLTLAFPVSDRAIMHDWWIGLVASSFGHIGHLNRPTLKYRQHDQNDTGAQRFGIAVILNKIAQLFGTKMTLKYATQAGAFLEHFEMKLSSEHYELVEAVATLSDQSWLRKLRLIVKFQLFKSGVIRNLGWVLSR